MGCPLGPGCPEPAGTVARSDEPQPRRRRLVAGRDERSGRYEVGVEVPASAFARRASELAPEEDESLVDESFEDDESLVDESFEGDESLVDESFEGDESLVDESFEESDSRSSRRPWALAPWSFL